MVHEVRITLNDRKHGAGFRLDPRDATGDSAGRAIVCVEPGLLESQVIDLFLFGPVPEPVRDENVVDIKKVAADGGVYE